MEPELSFRKIIIDSRNAVVGDAENFTISLPSTLQLPAQTACYVLDVALSYGVYTVETGLNDQLYFWERHWNASQGITLVTTATLSAGSYTATSLASGIQAQNQLGIRVLVQLHLLLRADHKHNTGITWIQQCVPKLCKLPWVHDLDQKSNGQPSATEPC